MAKITLSQQSLAFSMALKDVIHALHIKTYVNLVLMFSA